MDGGEAEFLNTIARTLKEQKGRFTYVEIGLWGAETFKPVWDLIVELRGGAFPVRAIGLELPETPNIENIRRKFGGDVVVTDRISNPKWGHATVILRPSKEALTGGFWNSKVDVAFIDGCHGKPCVKADFIALSKFMNPGGTVIFHDAGEIEQTSSFQPHCGTGIDVRAALKELGLLDNTRPGWQFVGMLPTMNQCAVFRKTV